MGLGSGLLDFIGGAAETAGAIASNRMTSQLEQEADAKKAEFAAKIQGKLQADKDEAARIRQEAKDLKAAERVKAQTDSAKAITDAKIKADAAREAARTAGNLSVQGLRNSGAMGRQEAADDEANYRAIIDAATRRAVADKQERARKYDADHRGSGSRKSDDSGPVSSLINFISGGSSGGLPIR